MAERKVAGGPAPPNRSERRRVSRVGGDLIDAEGAIADWFARFGAAWVILRPDRFVFALGDGRAAIDAALTARHRQVGRG